MYFAVCDPIVPLRPGLIAARLVLFIPDDGNYQVGTNCCRQMRPEYVFGDSLVLAIRPPNSASKRVEVRPLLNGWRMDRESNPSGLAPAILSRDARLASLAPIRANGK